MSLNPPELRCEDAPGGAPPHDAPRHRTISSAVVPVQTTPTFRAGNPSELFDGWWFAGQTARTYDVSADGQRFLMIKDAQAADGTGAWLTMTIVLKLVGRVEDAGALTFLRSHASMNSLRAGSSCR